MTVILYGTEHCPMCKGLELNLKSKKIEYKKITDLKVMQQKGIMSVPVLEISMNSIEAMNFVNNYNKENI